MNAVIPTAGGGPEVLDLRQVNVSTPQAGEVLIRVAFAGINRHDVGQRKRGHPPAGATPILGLEVAGEVVAIGPGVAQDLLGRRVCALVNGGGYADYCLAEAALCLDVPAGMPLEHAAAVPEGLFTFWFNVVTLGGLTAGKWLLVHGGSSGVGSLGIQVAKWLGARVITTSGTEEKCRACLALGADHALNYRTADFEAEAMKFTDGRGVDVILDMVGGLYAQKNVDTLAMDGHLVHLTHANGPEFKVALSSIIRKRAVVTGSLMRGLESDKKHALARELRESVWPDVAGRIKPLVHSVYPLAEVRAAHALMDSGEQSGKVLLRP
ncbi:NAD(P)H-quinone oxidoreductase [Ramlibacter sp. AW1]|uniref:NAD(P)H-quinone oxidoreductase n=2 Tax=Ramlibacter aurantiacus TaxID=2801330 RepID=A0A936ZI90_9BURK|nr:NAD(P)H-quinone oxidoreductase [Ramlibacter aurantiacus]